MCVSGKVKVGWILFKTKLVLMKNSIIITAVADNMSIKPIVFKDVPAANGATQHIYNVLDKEMDRRIEKLLFITLRATSYFTYFTQCVSVNCETYAPLRLWGLQSGASRTSHPPPHTLETM